MALTCLATQLVALPALAFDPDLHVGHKACVLIAFGGRSSSIRRRWYMVGEVVNEWSHGRYSMSQKHWASHSHYPLLHLLAQDVS